MFSLLRLIFLFVAFAGKSWAGLAQETIYLTWQKNPATTMTIQWISPSQEKETAVQYRPCASTSEWIQVMGETLPFPSLPKYIVHRVEINQLQPNTEYIFRVVPFAEEYRFMTAPAKLEKEIRFVVGGDIYHDDISFVATTCKQAAQFEPLFALIGGDIAYAVPSLFFSSHKPERWIEWVKVWHACMVTPKKRLIPTFGAVGNHDVLGQYNQTPAEADIFSTLFPMPGARIYNVLDFETYLSILILDTGHANPIGGLQTQWLKNCLDSRQHLLHRLAIYHVPAYPSIRKFHDSQSEVIRKNWIPLFERGGIQAVFENHDHAYKRTYPLLNHKENPKGIVYIGDGGWGVEYPRYKRKKRKYIAKFASVRHFVAVTLTPTQQYFQCITDKGILVDQFSQSIMKSKPLSNP